MSNLTEPELATTCHHCLPNLFIAGKSGNTFAKHRWKNLAKDPGRWWLSLRVCAPRIATQTLRACCAALRRLLALESPSRALNKTRSSFWCVGCSRKQRGPRPQQCLRHFQALEMRGHSSSMSCCAPLPRIGNATPRNAAGRYI